MRFSTTLTSAILFLLVSIPASQACTVIAVGKDATADGSVLVSQTDTGQDSRIYVVHGQKHEPGSTAPVYFGIQDATLDLRDDGEVLGYIPQAEETYTYFHTAYSHINEHQLAIAETTTAQREELKVTSVVITHDMESAYRVADRIGMLHDGVIRFMGTPEEIRSCPDPVVRGFIEGRPELLEGAG